MVIILLLFVYVLPVFLCLLSLAWIYTTRPEAFDDFPILFKSEFRTPHESDFSRRFIIIMFMLGACVPIANWFELGYMTEWFVVQFTHKLTTRTTLPEEPDNTFPVLPEASGA